MARGELDDRRWRDLLKDVREMDGGHVKVGVLADHGGNVKPEGSDFDLVDIAHLHEYGDPEHGVKERSFIRRVLVEKVVEIAEMQRKLAGQIVLGKMTQARALGLLGAFVAGEVRKLIASGAITPANEPSTVAAKGSSKPLVDQGILVNSITFEVSS